MKHLAPSSRNHVADHYQDGRRQRSTACSHMQLWTVTGLWGCMCVKGPKSFCSKTLAACTMEAPKPQRPHTEPFLQTLHPNRGALNPKPFLQTLHPKRGAKSREPEAPSFFEVFSHRQARFYCQNIIIITIVLVAVAIITIVVAAIVICCY